MKERIVELNNLQASEHEFETARRIFVDYFSQKYKDIPSDKLGIQNVSTYLDSIFDKTLHALKHENLSAFFAYLDDTVVGFATFGPLEQEQNILLRTIPVHLEYEHAKRDIRLSFVNHIRVKYPKAQKVILMVRPANISYTKFCAESDFNRENELFDTSAYLAKTYGRNSYDIYSKNI